MPAKRLNNRILLDVRPDRLDLRDREYRPPLISLPNAWPLKKDYEALLQIYKENKLILDQGKDGACTGFGLAAVINYLFIRDLFDANDGIVNAEMMKDRQVSSKMLYDMARMYDEWDGEDYEGSSCRGAMKGWHRHGVCKKTTWPHKHETDKDDKETYPLKEWSEEAVETPLGAYYRINEDSIVDMQAAIKEVGAIYCSAKVHKGWCLNETKELPTSDGTIKLPTIKYRLETKGGHAFAILGYNEYGFIVQNSWGDQWGHLGFAVLTYKDWVENGIDAWVAVRGATLKSNPSALKPNASPHTFSNHSLQTIGSDHTKRGSSTIGKALSYPYAKKDEKILPWSEGKAYNHTLVIGNNGRPKLTIVSASTPEESAKAICYTSIKEWMQNNKKNRKVVIYAQGGLNNEEDSINRTRVMAPYFKANNIYPIFVTWKTGVIESISNQIEDYKNSILFSAGIKPSSTRAKGFFGDWAQETLDYSIEVFSRNVMLKGIWSEMKENARHASDRAVPGYPQHDNTKAGAMVIMAKELEKLKNEFNCEIHLVGHSAGAILFGYWMKELTKRDLSINSLTLYAPACTLEFANKYYGKACNKNIFSKKDMHIHMMDDERERADNVKGIYKKSLLYLVSRALEDIHKTPLLGMAAAWEDTTDSKKKNIFNYAKENDIFNDAQYAEMKKWSKFAKKKNRTFHSKANDPVQTSLLGDHTNLAHGSFDNDINIIEKTIKQIEGVDKLKFPVKNLNGF